MYGAVVLTCSFPDSLPLPLAHVSLPQCMSVIHNLLHLYEFHWNNSFQKSHPGQVGSWNNFQKSPTNQLPPVRSTSYRSYHQLFCVSPFFGGQDSLSFSPSATCLHQIQVELQHHVAWEGYGNPLEVWRFLLETTIFQVNHVEFPRCRHNLMNTFYWNCQLPGQDTHELHPFVSVDLVDWTDWLTQASIETSTNEVIFMAIECHPIVFSRSAAPLFVKSNTRPKSHASINGVRMKWSMLLILGISHQFWTL